MPATLTRLLAAVSALLAGPRPQGSPLDPARWLAGCWELQRGNRITLEMWMPPAASTGNSYSVSQGGFSNFDLSLTVTDGG